MELLRTPRTESPLQLMQEAYRDDPWALLVGCILFNVVHGTKARPVLEEFLRRWPNRERFWERAPHNIVAEMVELFKPLGFQNRRAERIVKMTIDFEDEVSRCGSETMIRPEQLHGIGKYGEDSFEIFCRGNLIEDAKDKELRAYVKWAKARLQGGDSGIPSEEHSPGSQVRDEAG